MPVNNNLNSVKVTIFLAKDGIEEDRLIEDGIEPTVVGSYLAYKKQIPSHSPKWSESFFDGLMEVQNQSASVVVKIPLNINGTRKIFLLTFGHGQHLVNQDYCESRFGLKIALNIGDAKNTKSVDTKTMEGNPKQKREQPARSEDLNNLGINKDSDILKSITLPSKDLNVGKTITGSTSLQVSIPVNIYNIEDYLRQYFNYFCGTEYITAGYEWIDNIIELSNRIDSSLIDSLNLKLLGLINARNFESIWGSPPEIIDWTNSVGFSNSKSDSAEILDEIDIDYFTKKNDGSIVEIDSIDKLKNKQVLLIDNNENIIKRWSLFRCIYAEITMDNGELFILTEGVWYKINSTYSQEIMSWFDGLSKSNLIVEKGFTEYSKIPLFNEDGTPKTKNGRQVYQHNEGKYNEGMVSQGFLLLDKKLSRDEGIEICDLYQDKTLYHIKVYDGSSAPISHLINQGATSAVLFVLEKRFREDFNQKIVELGGVGLTGDEIESLNNRNNFTVVYGIIKSVRKDFNLPFFSKLNMKSGFDRINLTGMNIKIGYINGSF